MISARADGGAGGDGPASGGGTGGSGFAGNPGNSGGSQSGGGGGAAGGGNGAVGGAGGGLGGAGGSGGAGGTAGSPNGQNGSSGTGGGGGGGGGGGFNGAVVGAIANGSPLVGGNGGDGGAGGSAFAGGGGGGAAGYGAVVTGSGASGNASSITGGNGGGGGSTGFGDPRGGGGDGGDGGLGVLFTASGVAFANAGTVAGGNGGSGGSGSGSFGFQSGRHNNIGGAGGVGILFAASGAMFTNSGAVAGGNAGSVGSSSSLLDAGGGREGGAGVQFTASGATFTNFGTAAGGNGANGGSTAGLRNGNGGGGGGGGAGVQFASSGAAFTNSGAVTGGNGGAGGFTSLGTSGGGGGNGGAGVQFGAGGATLTNSGTITGGNGGIGGSTGGGVLAASGVGGAGVVGTGLTVINSGSISGGLSGDGGTRANAIAFTGGTNTLELRAGSTIVGNVAAFSSADTFRLGGTSNASFDVAQIGTQYLGFGVFQKTGSSTWALTGTNTASMPWTIDAGTLQLGTGGTSGSIAGNVINNANFAFNRSDAFTFGGAISGTGAVQQIGPGVTTLTGASTYTGPTTVNAGTLSVNGSIASSAVTVNGGAALGGTGMVGTTTINRGGALSPGNSIGTITINGNLVFGAGAIYRVEVSPTSADRTNVTGTAILAGTAQLVFGTGSYTSNSYTILSAAGGRSGTFDAVTTENLPAVLSANLSYTANDVLLVTLKSDIAKVLPGITSNQRAVAAAQDTIFNTGLPAISALYNLTLSQLPGALDQISGEVHASTAGALVDESLYVRSTVLGRLRQASYGGDASMTALALGGPQTAFQRQAAVADEALDLALAYGKSRIVTKAPLVAPAPSRDIVFWAQAFGGWGKFDGDGNAASLKRDLAGLLTGFDARFGSWRGGLAAGYTGSRNNTDGRGSANVETAHIAAYGGVNISALHFRAGGAYAFHTIDTDRTIAFPGFADRATAHYAGGTGQIFAEAGYGFAFGKIAFEPFAGAAWVHLQTDAFYEKGGLAALSGGANIVEVGYSTLGVRAASVIPIGYGMILVPRASAAWQHAFGNVTPTATLAFQGTPTAFAVAGVPIARDGLLTEAGLDLHIGPNATLGVSYAGQLASNVQDHAAKGKFNWRF